MRLLGPCKHEGFHESSSHYDREHGKLKFVLVCPGCGDERLAAEMTYRPDFKPHGNDPYLKASP